MLSERRARIEQGLRDAEQARLDRESAEAERLAALAEARREAKEILDRSQKVAQETRDADIAATRAELERMRERAEEDIEAEKQRAIADLRQEVANLALEAASKVVGESMTDERHRRLVDELLPAISNEYRRLLDEQRGIVAATVTSARPLSSEHLEAVGRRVEEMMSASVSMTPRVDAALIGGLTVQVGDRLIDGSVRGRLERLRERLLGASR